MKHLPHSGHFHKVKKAYHNMDNLLDNHLEFSVFFIMSYKVIRFFMTFRANPSRTRILAPTNLLAVLVNFFGGG
jgi:hypothetical protein